MHSIEYDKLKIGDTFIGSINSSKYPEYNNFSIIINVVNKYETEVTKEFKHIIVVNYLVNNDEKNIDSITEDNCICTRVLTMQDRFIPIIDSAEEHIKNVAKIPVYPDEDGRLYEYNARFYSDEKKFVLYSDDLEYIGNYTLPIPKNNFRPIKDENELFFIPKSLTGKFDSFVDQMISSYQGNNLKEFCLFDKEILESARFNQIQWLKMNIKFDRHLRKLEEQLKAEGKSLDDYQEFEPNQNTEVDPETGDTLTRVGGDDCKW